jgi:hypothetical protein
VKLPFSVFVIPSLMAGTLALSAPVAVCGTKTGADSAKPILVVPFELNSNKIYLEAHVGPEKRWFILDSGAPVTFLDRDLAVALGLNPKGNSEDAGLGESPVEIGAAPGIVLRLGELELPPRDVQIMPLDEILRRFEGRTVGGLVGNDIISSYVVEIDYERNLLRWYDPSTFEYRGPGQQVPVTFDGHAFVRTRLTAPGQKPIEGNFLLDVGVRNAFMLYAPFVSKHGLLPDAAHTLFTTVGCGVGGEVRSYAGRLQSCELGGFVLAGPIATLSKDAKGLQATDHYDGILGAELLKRFKLYLDFSRHRIYLEPNRAFRQPFEFDMSGLFVTAEGPELRTFQVLRVIDGSPASEAGIREGDEIVAVDGRPASELSLEALRNRFVEVGKKRELAVRRGAQTLHAKITLRKLV